jgi:flagellar protein FlaG
MSVKEINIADDKIVRCSDLNFLLTPEVREMQINNLSYVSGAEKWTIVGPQPYDSSQNGETAANQMAAQANEVVKDVDGQKNTEAAKTATDEKKSDKVDKDGKNGGGNQSSQNDNLGISFTKHEATGEMIVQVIDKDTGKVVREIPPKKLLDALAVIWKNAGICVDKKA